MKLFIVLALACMAAAQLPLPMGYDPLDPLTTMDNGDYNIDQPWSSNPYKWNDFINSRQRGFYGKHPFDRIPRIPLHAGMPLPSYGPYVRYGNAIVPYTHVMPYAYNPINQYSPIGPYTPFSSRLGQVNPIHEPMLLPNPYSRIGGSHNVFNPIVDPRLTNYGDVFSPIDSDINEFSSPYTGGIGSPYTGGIDTTIGFTPYSQSALFNLITRAGVGKMDLYSKLILGKSTGLNRKMREVCPEVDGGLSYVSCLTDAHSKTFRCLKGVESHPRFATCTHKPIVKKAMRDWYVHDYNWHKEVVKCLSTTTYTDKATEKMIGVPQLTTETDFDLDDSSSSSSSDEDTFGTKSSWNVDVRISTRQCFYKLRRETSKCQQAASQCPKFKKCYVHPIIKSLELRKHVKQAQFVKLLDSCLAGAIIPEGIVPEDTVVPETFMPEMLI